MKKFLMALVVLAIASAPALAGPNANGVVVVHNTGVAWSSDPFPTVTPACAEIVNTVAMVGDPSQSVPVVWKVYAAFPVDASPRVKTCGWAYELSTAGAGGIVIEHNDAQSAAVFYITSAGWGTAGVLRGDVGMSFTDSARVDIVNELWWFSGYAYAGGAGEPQMFSLAPNVAIGNQVFGDDAFPTNEDPITGYGTLGFGTAGYTPCPTGIVTGACCFTTGECTMLTAVDCQAAGGSFVGGDCVVGLCPTTYYGACCVNYVCAITTPESCAAAGGTYYGNDSVCTPDLCPPPVPTESKSWGQIKNNYR